LFGNGVLRNRCRVSLLGYSDGEVLDQGLTVADERSRSKWEYASASAKCSQYALEEDTLNAICEREQAVANPASCIPDSIALRTMLDQLEPKHRASLLLAIIDGRTHQEIGGYLRVPVGTVKAWIRRELVAMRRQLE
jgi:DNA-directed RNA polymerase specialized sigma24 family protein